MSRFVEDVYDFHKRFGCLIQEQPAVPVQANKNLREDLITEEFHELLDALDAENLAAIAKEICDLIYVAVGTAVSWGIDLDPVWELVHAANMAKIGGATRPDGKILKPAGWKAPDIASEIRRQQEGGVVA